ncbi:MAG: NAD-dependent epimerase/dehydratase family protein [Pseudomonadota bacterium]
MILLTGVAGFIGFHTTVKLLERGEHVVGVDNLNTYYPAALKRARLAVLEAMPGFEFAEADIADPLVLPAVLKGRKPSQIVHLAAQAGVRYSIENPAAYVASNLVGHAVILEAARRWEVDNMLYASSSSVYGGNTKTPFSENDVTDDPVSFYGATKKSNELLSNSYARLYGLSLTGLRFFTVYGPWGRPDMAYWIFVEKILAGETIRIFNEGRMSRDFTYIDDIVAGVLAALDRPASGLDIETPHRVYNLGNDQPEELMSLVDNIETALGQTAHKSFDPMQPGDVERTWADIARARAELDYAPRTDLKDGIEQFADWFRHWRTR